MIAICAFCASVFDNANGDHGCSESRPQANLVDRLRHDHCDTIECEHGFMLHRDPCPNVVCLARDLAEAADEIERLRAEVVPPPGRVFALRNSATDTLKFVLAPGETVQAGDLLILDRATGKVRRALPEDTGLKFTVPPGSKVTEDGYLEMPR